MHLFEDEKTPQRNVLDRKYPSIKGERVVGIERIEGDSQGRSIAVVVSRIKSDCDDSVYEKGI